MSPIRYVCLSDTHFGAECSLLTQVEPGTVRVDVGSPSPVLAGLVRCLEHILGGAGDGPKPSLVLHGDIFELALAETHQAFMAFERFLELAFPARGPALFGPRIYYVPGNHDHHLWELAREQQYGDYLRTRGQGSDLEPPSHTTRLVTEQDPAPVESSLLNTLIRRHGHLSGMSVRVIYPNLGLLSPDGARFLIVHHGHFTEAMYRLMSELRRMIFPDSSEDEDVSSWEGENFAWIDFFWSTLGRSGPVGQEVGLIYDMLQSPEATRLLIGNLSQSVARLRSGNWITRPAFSWALRAILRWMLVHAAGTERMKTDELLTEGSRALVRRYLEGPVLRQLRAETKTQPRGATFVFGHTHKPFEARWSVDGYPEGVSLFNSGGWVVDSEDTLAHQGASVILLDERLDAVALRLYNQAENAADYAVRVVGLPSSDAESGAFLESVSSLVNPQAPPWKDFSLAVARGILERRQALSGIVQRGVQAARGVRAPR